MAFADQHALDRPAAVVRDAMPGEKAPLGLPAWMRGPAVGWWGEPRVRRVEAALRDPDEVMTAEALSSLKACNLSFSRTLVRAMVDGRWSIRRRMLRVDAAGAGRAIYDIDAEGHVLSFIVLSNAWDGEEKQGRRMEKTTDFKASLVFGRADDDLIEREIRELDVDSWAGRTDSRSLGWTAANRSQRFFEHVVEALSRGTQPDAAELAAGSGYILRNAGFYGNGRSGAVTWLGIPEDHPLAAPYHVDLFSLYLWRLVGIDFAEAIAAARAPGAARLDPEIARYVGIGNSSGLGMTCAVVRWPQWVGAWCLARETVLAYAASDAGPSVTERMPTLQTRLDRAVRYYREVSGPVHSFTPHDAIAAELEAVSAALSRLRAAGATDWHELRAVAAACGCRETVEQLNALLIDMYPEIAAAVAAQVPAAMRRQRDLVPGMRIGALRAILTRDYGWALAIDQTRPGARQHFWYHSQDLGEQRRGERGIDPGVRFETFVDVVGTVQRCATALEDWPDDATVARFVFAHPEHLYIVSRMQFMAGEPYAEVRSNLIDADYLPIRLIRFLFTVFGFESGTPHSSAWVRGVLLQGAPTPEEIAAGRHRDWSMPVAPKAAAR